MFERIKSKEVPVPHKTQLSRCRVKLDMLLMQMRQQEWSGTFAGATSDFFVYLSADASPQGSLEYFLVLEDRITREHAASIAGATPEERDQWCRAGYLKTTTLPPTILGSGKASAASKFEALTHAVILDTMCDADPGYVARYSQSVVSYCSDFGPESNLSYIPSLCIQDLLASNVKNSGGLLAMRGELASNHLQPLQDDCDELDEDVVIVAPAASSEAPAPEPSESKDYFGLSSALMIPGVKHLFDNCHKDLVSVLSYYPSFSDTCLSVH